MAFPLEPLGPQHDRAAFSCGTPLIDSFLHERVRQFAARDLTNAFVMVDQARTTPLATIAGFYTLSSHGLDYEETPDTLRRGLPKRLRVGVALIGYLGVDERYKEQGLGRILLFDALYRVMQASQHLSTRAVIVDAVDDAAISFYEHHNFIRFADDSRRLYRMMDTIRTMFTTAKATPPAST